MRFQVGIRKDKLKSIENIITMAISLIKAKSSKYTVYFIFVAAENQIRILVQSEVTPIVIALSSQFFSKIVSISKTQSTNSSIGFQFKNGLSFLQNFLSSIKQDSGNLSLVSQQDKTLIMKITKDKEFRSLEIRSKDSLKRQQIQKPTKNQNQLFKYQWLDGVTRTHSFFQVNPAGLIQILKVSSKIKNHYIIQVLQQKKLILTLNMDQQKLSLNLKCPQSPISVTTKFTKIEGHYSGKCQYEIKIDDAEILMLALKQECLFVIDEEKNLSVSYTSASTSGAYNCQICLKEIVFFVMEEGMGARGMIKNQT